MICCVSAEELELLACGELVQGRAAELEAHLEVCAECRAYLQAMHKLDGLLGSVPRHALSPGDMLETRRLLARELSRGGAADVLTLEQVATLLKLSTEEFAKVAPSLPAFEVGGRVRIRRERLSEWIAERERQYAATVAGSRIAECLSPGRWEGVA